jgi:hypothetical protein
MSWIVEYPTKLGSVLQFLARCPNTGTTTHVRKMRRVVVLERKCFIFRALFLQPFVLAEEHVLQRKRWRADLAKIVKVACVGSQIDIFERSQDKLVIDKNDPFFVHCCMVETGKVNSKLEFERRREESEWCVRLLTTSNFSENQSPTMST